MNLSRRRDGSRIRAPQDPATKTNFRLRWDQRFESAFLQRRVHETLGPFRTKFGRKLLETSAPGWGADPFSPPPRFKSRRPPPRRGRRTR
jgi:hypothetical protein